MIATNSLPGLTAGFFFVKKVQPTKKIDLVVSAEVTLAAMESFLTHSCFSESA
jgi:hypothetical protein